MSRRQRLTYRSCVQVEEAVKAALKDGYRHIDTAAAYGNEKEVGQAIKESGVPREELWITTKLNNPDHKSVSEALDASLKALGVDYVDLYLMVRTPTWMLIHCSFYSPCIALAGLDGPR